MIAAVIILLVIIILFYLLHGTNIGKAYLKNTTPRKRRFIRYCFIVLFVLSLGYALYKSLGYGNAGLLEGKFSELSVPVKEELLQDENEGITVRVTQDEITVNGKKYDDINAAKEIIFKGIGAEEKISLVDDYAMASAFEEVRNELYDMGVDPSNIIEMREP